MSRQLLRASSRKQPREHGGIANYRCVTEGQDRNHGKDAKQYTVPPVPKVARTGCRSFGDRVVFRVAVRSMVVVYYFLAREKVVKSDQQNKTEQRRP